MSYKKYINPTTDDISDICLRPMNDQVELQRLMDKVFANVDSRGDKALRSYTMQFDKVELEAFAVSKPELEDAKVKVSDNLKAAIILAKTNIEVFHSAQVQEEITVEIMNGVKCSQRQVPIEKVGLYIPGGTAPLFSTVLMLSIPAKLAGCKDIILCTPPNANGEIDPAILYTVQLCGIDQIFKVGGAQAIAAMSIGTESIPKVSKIFGPGNQYVTAAKSYAQKYGVGMDMPAGPSELLVFASDTAVPSFVASDLLSQAEHGVDSQVLLVTTNAVMIDAVLNEIDLQIEALPRKDIAKAALRNSKFVQVDSEREAFDIINEYGPEHLIIASENPDQYVSLIVNAGSVFLGNYCPESAGDYASGTNHTLPTNGWAKSYNGVNVDSFSRKITFQSISSEGIEGLGNIIITMAENEQLQAHANAVKVRLQQLKANKR